MIFKVNYNVLALCLSLTFFSTVVSAVPSKQSNNLFNDANNLLDKANLAEKKSSEEIVSANKIRKELNKLRSKVRKAKDSSERNNLTKQADKLASQLKNLQDSGSKLREENKHLFKQSLEVFEEAIVERWGKKIRNRKPVSMDSETTSFISHNTRFRSVHPNMLNKMGTPTDNINPENVNKEMSLLVPALAGQNAPPDLDISSFQISRKQQYFAHIEVVSTTQQGEVLAPLNEIHKWHLILSNLSGEPIENANVEIIGHMPGHVHGLPTEPRVTEEVEPGVYKVEGVKFQMKGWWVMQFNVTDEKASSKDDSVVFNLVF